MRKLMILMAFASVTEVTAQTVEVSRAAYEKDKSSFLDLLDAERSLRDIRLRNIQAVTLYESAVADLERAVGADLRRKP